MKVFISITPSKSASPIEWVLVAATSSVISVGTLGQLNSANNLIASQFCDVTAD